MSDPTSGSNDSFAALFEQTSGATAKRNAPKLRVGDRVEGRVVQVGRDTVFVDLPGGVQGYVEAVELRDDDGNISLKEGDTLAARVVEVDGGRGHVKLARQMSRGGKPGSSAALEQAKEAGIAIEGKVTGVNKGGLDIDVAGTRAFCPVSQASDRFLENPSELIGQTLRFLVTEIKDGGKNVIVSRRALLKREAAEAAASGAHTDSIGAEEAVNNANAAAHPAARPFKGTKDRKPQEPAEIDPAIAAIVVNGVVKGAVDRIEAYGVFLQVEGTKGRAGHGLVPAAELGVPRGTDLKKKFPLGTVLTAKVLEVGEGKLRLSVRGAAAAEERADFEAAKTQQGAPKTLGTFADLFTKKK